MGGSRDLRLALLSLFCAAAVAQAAHGKRVSVADFGAKGLGDDTTAIQRTLAAVCATGSVIAFPAPRAAD